jgi:hypothetical protein
MHDARRLALLTAVFGAGLAAPVPAQEQTASIEGRVCDPSGAGVSGAAVVAANGDGWSVSTTADKTGIYRFLALPPGRLSLTANAAGFTVARVDDVDLRLGQRLDVPLTLTLATQAETVQVVAESSGIAITQSARATSLRREEIRRLPLGREYQAVVRQVSGANSELTRAAGALQIDGSSAVENRFVVDGIETTDLIYGTSRQLEGRSTVTDFLDEVQVKSSGYAAEYGGSTGGVVNVLTRSGGNAWHGEALVYGETSGLDAGPRPTLRLNPRDATGAEYVTYPEDPRHAVEPGFTLGGPIARDRLWFFAGYVPRFELTSRTASFNDGVMRTLDQRSRFHQAVASLTGQLGPAWRFRTTFDGGRSRRSGLLPQQDGSSSPDAAYDDVLVQPRWSASGSVDWTPGPRFLTSFRAGYWFRDWHNESVYQGDRLGWQTSSIGLPGVPPAYQQAAGHSNVPTNTGWDRQRQGRLALQWDGTLSFEAAGRHWLKGGVQLERRTLSTLGGNTGNVHNLFWGQAFFGQRGPLGYYQVVSNPVFPNRGFVEVGDVRSTNLGLFLQDAWTVHPRLTLNLGLRAENEHVPSFSRDPAIPDTAIHFGFGDKLAPRVGFAWDATGDGKTKLYGSWGVFYDVTKLLMPLRYAGDFLSFYWFTLDDGDLSRIENNPACPPDCPGRLIFGPLELLAGTPINDPAHPTVDPDLAPAKLQERVVGVEREIARDLTLSVRYVHKQLDRTVDDLGLRDAGGEFVWRIANPGFGIARSFVPEGGTEAIPYPKARRDYDAVELGLQKRLSGAWSGRLVYLWSRLWGNTGGLTDSSFYAIAPNSSRTWDSVIMPFDQGGRPVHGDLATDRTHQLKAQLVYQAPFGTTIGASWFGASGIPRSRLVAVVPGQGFPVFYDGRGTDGRGPFTSQLDLQVQHRIRLSPRVSVTLLASAFNVFNEGRPTDYIMHRLFPGQAIDISEAGFFAGFDAERLAVQQGLVPNPEAGMAWAFQPPRSVRLGARISF